MKRLIRLREVLNRVGLSKATVYRRIREGTFPSPCPLDSRGRSVAWVEGEIDKFIADCVAARGSGIDVVQGTDVETIGRRAPGALAF